MLEMKSGDILTAEAEALVNTVNCVGVMGKGLALQFKHSFPQNYRAYRAACENNEVVPGRIFVHETGELYPRYIMNFPTKRHWRNKSRLEDIHSGLQNLVEQIDKFNISSVAIPALGSNLGGLDWQHVLPIIKTYSDQMKGVRVLVYEPDNASVRPHLTPKKRPELTEGRAAMIMLAHNYVHACLDPFITLLEIQKLMYFMQQAGQSLGLVYVKRQYGPYARNLGNVLAELDGHYISGYGSSGEHPDKELTLIYEAVPRANALLETYPDTIERVKQVGALVYGFETPSGLELLASVHWAEKYLKRHNNESLVSLIHNWDQRKKKFSETQIEKARDRLKQKGWI